MNRRSLRRRLWPVLLLYLVLALLYNAATPLFESPDEPWHVGMAVHLARGGGLPIQRSGEESLWRQEGSQPPLYYAILAALTRTLRLPLDDFEAVYLPNPHAHPGDATQIANRNQALHGSWERLPWRGAVFTLHFWRLISTLLGLLTVLATVEAIGLLFPRRPLWAVGSGLLVAVNPMFLFIAASVNNDVLINALTALSLWLLALRFRSGFSWLRAILLGVVLGAAALAKLSGLILWPLALAGLLGIARQERRWQRALLEMALIFAIALALCAWWFWRNWTLYHDPLGLSVMLDIVGRRSATIADLLREYQGMRRSFWGVFGWMNILMPDWAYAALDLWMAFSALGLLVGAARNALQVRRVRRWGEEWVGGLWLLAYTVVLGLAFLRWTAQTMASQGRLMFPAIGPISLGFWVGWGEILRPLEGRLKCAATLLRSLPVGLLSLLALLAPVLWIAPAYRPPDLAETVNIPNRLEAIFGDEFRLLGYDLSPSPLEPEQAVDLTLYLEALRSPTRDWSLFVHLVDDLDIILAQDDRYPRQGLTHARSLRAGQRWAETFRLTVPATAVAPSHLTLKMGFYDLSTGERMPVLDAAGNAVGDRLPFGELALLPRSGSYPNPLSYRFGDRVELVGFEITPRRVRRGEAVTLTLYWRALRPIEHDYTVFTHVLEPPQTIWGQDDQPPAPPTSQWRVGEVYRETYILTVKPETPAGFYEVEIGLYRPDSGERLHREDGTDFLFVSRIRVEH